MNDGIVPKMKLYEKLHDLVLLRLDLCLNNLNSFFNLGDKFIEILNNLGVFFNIS